jgi:hypothetical protein
VSLLSNDALDLAVSRGAVAYGLVRRGFGLRIGGGSARAYFIGVDGDQGICLIPKHLDEGSEVEIPRTFQLLLDQPARFSLFASTLALEARPGELTDVSGDDFTRLPPIETILRSGDVPTKKGQALKGAVLPVRLKAALTEIGTLELWCVAEDRDARWKLEFSLRGQVDAEVEASSPSTLAPMPRHFEEARERIEIIYGKKPAPVDKRDVKNLGRDLEKLLGPRDTWATPVIRELWSALYAGMGKRRRSAEHERLWCTLLGFCLRPGFGAPLDAWRAAESFQVFEQGLQFQKEPHNWDAWWVMWRRIAGGLDATAQRAIFGVLLPAIRIDGAKAAGKAKTVRTEGLVEMIRLAASLERVEVGNKLQLGEALFDRLDRDGPLPHLLWAVGRVGARVPFYGSPHACIDAPIAAQWLARLEALPNVKLKELVFPVAQIARVSGDRGRDLGVEERERAARLLGRAGAPDAIVRPVRELVVLTSQDEEKRFGESLPSGLKL